MLGRAGHQVIIRHFLGSLIRFRCSDAEAGVRSVLDDPLLGEQLAVVDAVVVNGEGSIHHGAGTEYLALLGAAQELGKATLLVNAVLQDVFGFDGILKKLDDFTVRESSSKQFAEQLGVPCRVVPDSCLEAGFSQQPSLDLCGADVLTDWHHERDADVGRACVDYLAGQTGSCAFLPLHFADASTTWRAFPATLRGGDVVVTARHHGVYLAAIAGRPFVPLGSNTFKMEGLLEGFRELGPVRPNATAIMEGVDWARHHRSAFEQFAGSLMGQLPLSTFRALGGSYDPGGEEREGLRLQRDVEAQWSRARPDVAYMMERRSAEMRLAAAHGGRADA